MPEKKSAWADNLRFVATISVIVLHVVSTGVYMFEQFPLHHWMIANIADSAVRSSVPLFLMLSGALLLGKTETIKTFYSKRISRVILPFLFWSIVYTGIYAAMFYFKGKPLSVSECIYNFVMCRGFFSQFAYHLWYIYVLLGIYLLSPLISRFLTLKNVITIPIFLIFWSTALILNRETADSVGVLTYGLKFAGYIGYYIAGYFLSEFSLKSNVRNKIILSFLAVALIFFTAFFTFRVSMEQNELNVEYYNFLSPNVVIYSLVLFLLIKIFQTTNEKFIIVRNFINEHSYGIYLSHVLFLWGFEMVGFDWNFIHPLIGIPLSSFALITVSSIFVWTSRKVAFLKIFVG